MSRPPPWYLSVSGPLDHLGQLSRPGQPPAAGTGVPGPQEDTGGGEAVQGPRVCWGQVGADGRRRLGLEETETLHAVHSLQGGDQRSLQEETHSPPPLHLEELSINRNEKFKLSLDL